MNQIKGLKDPNEGRLRNRPDMNFFDNWRICHVVANFRDGLDDAYLWPRRVLNENKEVL